MGLPVTGNQELLACIVGEQLRMDDHVGDARRVKGLHSLLRGARSEGFACMEIGGDLFVQDDRQGLEGLRSGGAQGLTSGGDGRDVGHPGGEVC